MIIVLDTTAAVEIVLNRERAQKIQSIIKDAEWIISVDLFISEVNNVFWKYYNFQNMPIDICKKSIDRAIHIIDDFESSIDLYKEAFSLACQLHHPVYDALYLVCARRKDASLITLDKKMYEFAKKLSIKIKNITNL
jgi:predicted nucleic acid-binding protein